jgi:hypothetical protein
MHINKPTKTGSIIFAIRESRIKPQRDTTTHPLGWLKLKRVVTPQLVSNNISEDREFYCFAEGGIQCKLSENFF